MCQHSGKWFQAMNTDLFEQLSENMDIKLSGESSLFVDTDKTLVLHSGDTTEVLFLCPSSMLVERTSTMLELRSQRAMSLISGRIDAVN